MRSLRFKEVAPGTDHEVAPADIHRSISDASLPAGPFRRRGTVDGFLDTGNHRPDAARNLVLLGDSFVESVFAPEQQRFASQLERALPPEWRVLNGGYSGMTSLHALAQLAAKVVPMAAAPHRLVYFVPMSDSKALTEQGLYWSTSNTVSPIAPAVSHAPAWDRRTAATRAIRAVLAAAAAFELPLSVVASPYRAGDLATDGALRALYRDDPRRYARSRSAFDLLHEVAREECARQDVPFLDAQPIMRDPGLFYDQLHLNLRGQDHFAQALTQWVAPQLDGPGDSNPAELELSAR